jgi:hypothetical protein
VNVQRQQVRAQVWPRLEWSTTNLEGFQIHINNVGVGPAEIRAVSVKIDGRPVTTWQQALERWKLSGDVKVLSLPGGLADTKGLDIELCYCSVLDECWTLDDPPSRPRSSCPPSAVAFDNH